MTRPAHLPLAGPTEETRAAGTDGNGQERTRALVARENALKSTGPQTPAGKAKASRNAVKHGLTARAVVLPHLEDAADWGAHRDGIVASLAPIGALEAELADRVAVLTWRLRRAVRAETDAVAGQLADADADAVAEARPRDFAEPLLDDDGFAETLESLRDDAAMLTARAERHRRVYIAETEGETLVEPGDLEVVVNDMAARAETETKLVERVCPGWRARRWTGREVVELARALHPTTESPAELLQGAHLNAQFLADDARRRLADAERRQARYRGERAIPQGNRGELLERYEGNLQRQLAMTLATLRAVRETFSPSTG